MLLFLLLLHLLPFLFVCFHVVLMYCHHDRQSHNHIITGSIFATNCFMPIDDDAFLHVAAVATAAASPCNVHCLCFVVDAFEIAMAVTCVIMSASDALPLCEWISILTAALFNASFRSCFIYLQHLCDDADDDALSNCISC